MSSLFKLSKEALIDIIHKSKDEEYFNNLNIEDLINKKKMLDALIVNHFSKIKMKSIVINDCYGGFDLSREAKKLYLERTGKQFNDYSSEDKLREDPVLIDIVKELGEKANGSSAELKIVEIPSNVEYEIEEHDGSEWISEKHRKWY